MKTAIFALVFFVTLPAMAEQIVGHATVKDGDSVAVDGVQIRLHGIDAPEWSQACRNRRDGHEWPCGRSAAKHLRKIIAGRPVACDPVVTDKYGRTVARCFAGRTDLNRRMVADGWAFAFRRYSEEFVAEEEAAQADGRGMWDSEVQPPWDYRAAHRR